MTFLFKNKRIIDVIKKMHKVGFQINLHRCNKNTVFLAHCRDTSLIARISAIYPAERRFEHHQSKFYFCGNKKSRMIDVICETYRISKD